MSDTPLRVGLTGGVAAGKSTVAAAFAERGVPVFSADAVAHDLTAPGAPMLARIRAEFGDAVFDETGALDRQALAARVFQDERARRRLEALLHPPIRTELARLAAAAIDPYCILEIPLLSADDVGALVDRVLLVELAPEHQVARLAESRGVDPDRARAVIAAQPAAQARQALADDVFVNDGELSAIPGAVDALDALYRTIAADRGREHAGVRLPVR